MIRYLCLENQGLHYHLTFLISKRRRRAFSPRSKSSDWKSIDWWTLGNWFCGDGNRCFGRAISTFPYSPRTRSEVIWKYAAFNWKRSLTVSSYNLQLMSRCIMKEKEVTSLMLSKLKEYLHLLQVQHAEAHPEHGHHVHHHNHGHHEHNHDHHEHHDHSHHDHDHKHHKH